MTGSVSVGVDVGGTHTDLVMLDHATGRLTVAKAPTTVDDPSRGTMETLRQHAEEEGVAAGHIAHFAHGTTVATNIALEHAGAKTGLITTHGFRDILHIARHKRPQTFSLQLDLPWQSHPLVPRRWRMTVPERIVPPGEILVPLDEDAVRAAVRHLVAEGMEAIAVCFLHAYLNPAHEARAAAIVLEEAPNVFLSLSHRVVPQYREYERFSTTALNAYVGPKTARYLDRMEDALRSDGVDAGIHLMQSSGGAATLAAASERPVNLLMSGPAGGLIGGIWVGQSAGFPSVITLDVGGTSADIGVAPDGQLLTKHILDTRLGDYHAMVPMAELDAIGAGGGSIAWIDAGGQFQVGPRSAGANPGPCCYGKGGVEPTATDAMLVLGWIDPDHFLGGRMRLHPSLAQDAITSRLAKPLNMTAQEAAIGTIRILTHSMVQAAEINSVRRGYDPRDFSLVAFGGAGPLFAAEIARELGVARVIVPPAPGLTSALGLLATDIAYDRALTVMASTAKPDNDGLAAAFAGLETEIAAQLAADGFAAGDTLLTRQADCRYIGQGHELSVAFPSGAITADSWREIRRRFDAAHARQYGKKFPEKPMQIVNVRVTGTGRMPQLAKPNISPADGPDPLAALITTRPAVFSASGNVETYATPRYDRSRLAPGHRIAGPAIIDQMDTTTVIPPGFSAHVDAAANLILERT
ncbi:MAG: hydantoinase/oxoprolinase family protein [Pseudomonadota bacterium]